MKRTNTVNFLQIENNLHSALVLCQQQPNAPYATSYAAELSAVAKALYELTQRADTLYLDWRKTIKQRLLIAKHLFKKFEFIRDELGEFGVDPEPKGRYNYWEGDLLREGVVTLLAFLEPLARDDDNPESIPEAIDWVADLNAALSDYDKALRDEARGLDAFKRVAPLRRQAIYRATRLIDEFQKVVSDYVAEDKLQAVMTTGGQALQLAAAIDVTHQ